MGVTVLVTGANRGLGLEFVRQLSARGDEVIATARALGQADELQSLEVRAEVLDVNDPASVNALARRLETTPLDVLLNNAGVGVRGGPLGELDFDQIAHYLTTNAIGPLRVTEALLPNLRSGQRKLVVNLTSKMGSIADNTGGGSYGYRASKAALNVINRSLAIDLRDESITCVVLHPGWVRTDMGGPQATLTVEQSVAGMLQVMDGLTLADSGRFLDYSGEEVPW